MGARQAWLSRIGLRRAVPSHADPAEPWRQGVDDAETVGTTAPALFIAARHRGLLLDLVMAGHRCLRCRGRLWNTGRQSPSATQALDEENQHQQRSAEHG
ncbi:MAG: hypothetical protein EPN60_06975 [Nevskiaceae bacterium]|nr:MAG: hypothetical protein EPO48_15160 [Nevskiaceae bacterium]TAM28740.1 MAG: hypothetical protein EPN60_06975 [Nevskiaceae bacterium]